MNIKSLLLGSAAALVAVSGARAADAVVVAEPEPMEFVRICDTYGTGFYYIPGTETCLKIGGMIRYQIDFSSDDDEDVFEDEDGDLVDDDDDIDFDPDGIDEGDGGWRKFLRTEVSFDARSETELGTLRRWIVLRGEAESGFITGQVGDPYDQGDVRDSDVRVQHAVISLGGLALGLTDTLYDGDINGEFDSGGGDRVHFINYTFDAGNGISLTAGVEEASYNFDDYIPNVAGRVSIVQGWGGVNFYGAYDSVYEDGALKAIAVFKATDAITLNAIGIWESGFSFYSVGYEWSLGGSVKFQATEKIAITVGGQYFGNEHSDGDNDYAVGAVLDYNIVKDFDAKLALNYRDGDSFDDDGSFDGFLRLEAGF